MYSRHLSFRRNQFLHNRGFASVGLLLQACTDVIAEDNLIADNARGIFLEGSNDVTIRGNAIAVSDVAVVLFASTLHAAFIGNSFIGNLAPLSLVGRRTDADFTGNYWSDHTSLDLDGDGRADTPYRLSSLFDHFRGNVAAADLFSRSLSAAAIGAAEHALPVLEPVSVVDPSPLARPPVLHVPQPWTAGKRHSPRGLFASAAALALGVVTLGGRRLPAAKRKERSA
jgi:nitrous oxidase accessory protein